MATRTLTTVVASCFLLGVLTLISSVQGTGTIYVSLLSYGTAEDVIKSCCDLLGGSDGLSCEEEGSGCGLYFSISLSTLDGVRSVRFSAPLSWKPGTLTPTVFEFDGWAGGPTILGLELVYGDLMLGGQLVDSAQAGLTIAGPSDFYTSLTVSTDRAAVAQIMYRLACDTHHAGEDCTSNCLDQPELQVCSDQARQQPGSVRNTFVYDQALQYFGSPLARCPSHTQSPNSTLSPPDTDSSSTLSTLSSFPTSSIPSETPSATKTATINDASTAVVSSVVGTESTTSLSASTTTPVVPTKDLTSDVSDVSTTPVLLSSSSQATTISSTTQPQTTSSAQQQPSSASLVSEIPSLTKTTEMLSTVTPLSTLSTSSESPLTISTTPVSASPTETVHQTSSRIPVPPATLPVVQNTSPDPSRDPVTSRPSVTIPEFPATTALAQKSDDPMRFWAIIVGGVVGGLAVVAILGFLLYRSRQRTLQKRQEIYTVTPQSISSIEENGTSGRSDVPMTTALL